jgi:predicted nucleic acid-binding protein
VISGGREVGLTFCMTFSGIAKILEDNSRTNRISRIGRSGAGVGYFRRADLHKLSAVDATSFAIMKRVGIRLAYAFDRHFAMAGFRLVR